jgi:hypothetical protein
LIRLAFGPRSNGMIIEFERRRRMLDDGAPREEGASEQHVVRARASERPSQRRRQNGTWRTVRTLPPPSSSVAPSPARTTPDCLSLRPGTRLFALARFAFRGLLSADDYGPETGEAAIKWHWQRTGRGFAVCRLALDCPRPVTRARRGVGRLSRSHTHTRGNTPSSRMEDGGGSNMAAHPSRAAVSFLVSSCALRRPLRALRILPRVTKTTTTTITTPPTPKEEASRAKPVMIVVKPRPPAPPSHARQSE